MTLYWVAWFTGGTIGLLGGIYCLYYAIKYL